ncbi:WUS-interacting protein 2 [Artemisia annua]|uniref:WUS-interacting protein 2 n=1 Tax=Artemisia annua TaxID=35608 RepID=A0A2U1PAY6_ARTAN|nr:WUS-interacting protein 2 [Artemisia annua]
MDSSVKHDAPHCSTIKMAYNDDGTRLFASGISKEGKSYISEWDGRKGAMKQMYEGVGRLYAGDVRFDTTKNRFLAVGDEFLIKFWDLDRL